MEPCPVVSVIIPSLHRPDLTRRCLQCLSAQTVQQFAVVVVENSASAGDILQAPLPSNVRQLLLDKNYGTTGSVNRGLAVSDSKYVLLLNNDVELEPGFLEALISALDRHPECAFATGKLLSATARSSLDGAGDALLLGGGSYRLGHGDVDLGQFDHQTWVIAGCGAATLYRRSVLEQIHGLDEDFFAYLDDVDLGVRSHMAGHTGIYVPNAVAYHMGSATLGDPLHPRVLQWITRNQLFLLAKNYPARALLRLLPRITVFQLLWLGFVLKQAALLSYIKGIYQALSLLPGVLARRRQAGLASNMNDAGFLALLRASEGQVFAWHSSRPRAQRSTLLSLYFRVFPPLQAT